MSLLDLFGTNIAKLTKKGDAKGLRRALQSRKADVRKAAAEALGVVDDAKRSMGLIAMASLTARDWRLGPEGALEGARGFIGMMFAHGSSQNLEGLARALKDTDARVRATAAEAISKIWMSPALIEAHIGVTLRGSGVTEDEGIKKMLAALATSRSSNSVRDALLRALEDDDDTVRRQVVGTLGSTDVAAVGLLARGRTRHERHAEQRPLPWKRCGRAAGCSGTPNLIRHDDSSASWFRRLGEDEEQPGALRVPHAASRLLTGSQHGVEPMRGRVNHFSVTGPD
jgi:HEAT repeat protein